MQKVNRMLHLGIIIVALTVLLKQFFNVPHFIIGFGYGVGICLQILGALNSDFVKLRKAKLNFLKKVLNK